MNAEPRLPLAGDLRYAPHAAMDDRAKVLLHGIEQSREGFALTDAAGCFTYMNPEHLRIFGFKDQIEVLGKPWQILYPTESLARMGMEVFPALQAEGHWHGVIPARRLDGVIFSEDLTLSILPGGGIACNCRDRSSEVQMLERLATSEALFHAFVDHLPLAIAIKTTAGAYIFVNRQGAVIFEAILDSAIGHRASELFPPEIAEQIEQVDREVLRSGGAVKSQLVLLRNNEDLVLEAVTFPIVDRAGQVNNIGGIYVDITQRMRMEREVAKVAERQGDLIAMQREFVALVSHEFRTPLTVMQGSHYLLRKRVGHGSDDKVARYFDLQEESIQALRKLVDQVLLLNRLEYSTENIELTTISVTDLITTIVTRFNDSTLAVHPRLRLTCAVPPDLTLRADETLIRAALENLISNAIKYSAASTKVAIHVSTAKDELVIGISDEGRGIPLQQQHKMFAAFFRASNVGTTPGTGLGLSIVKRAVECHRGRIEFSSAEGAGTTFQLFFPLNDPTPMTSSSLQ
ncbi:MAG: ATP-binding protein [Opitutae bacterium]